MDNSKFMLKEINPQCTCNFSDETAAEIGHYPECPMVNKDLRYKRETKPENEKELH